MTFTRTPPHSAGPPRSPAAQFGSSFAAAAALVGLSAGVPLLLALYGGWPLPHSLPEAEAVRRALTAPLDQTVVVNVLLCAAWLAWAQFAFCVVVEARAALAQHTAARVPLASGSQTLARHLVVTALLLATSMRTVASNGASAQPFVPIAAVALREAAPTPTVAAGSTRTYVVKPGDTLWDLAEHHLGDGRRYKEIVELNRGRSQPDGRKLRDADLIRPGWTLLLPASPAVARSAPLANRIEPPAKRAAPPTTAPAKPAAPTPASETPAPSRPSARADQPDETPAASLVSVGFVAGLATAAAMGRRRRRSHYQPNAPAPGLRHAPLPGEVVPPSLRRPITDDEPPYVDDGLTRRESPDPARVELAADAAEPITLDLAATGGVGLTGAGADDAARALLLAALARGGPDDVRALVVQPTLDRLLPEPGQRAYPANLAVVASATDAVNQAELDLVRRARILEHEDVPNFATHRTAHPEEALPALVIVAGPDLSGESERLRALLHAGRRLGVTALLLDVPDVAAASLDFAADGTLGAAEPSDLAAQLTGTACRLTARDAADALAVLATARPAEDDVPMPQAGMAAEPFTSPAPADTPRVRVRLLGPNRIEIAGRELRRGLRTTGRALLCYYLLHPSGASREATIEALWPDADMEKADKRFWNALTSLRDSVREALGDDQADVITRRDQIYTPQDGLFDVDLWRLEAALNDAAHAQDDVLAIAALAQVADLYTGDLLDGDHPEWAMPAREDLRRRVLDALSRVADLAQQHGQPHDALVALDRAIAIDPYAEEMYCRAIEVHNALGNLDAARRLYHQLENQLADIDADPDPETTALLDQAGAARPAIDLRGPASPVETEQRLSTAALDR